MVKNPELMIIPINHDLLIECNSKRIISQEYIKTLFNVNLE